MKLDNTISDNINFLFDSKNNIFKINGQDVGSLVNFNFKFLHSEKDELKHFLGTHENCKYLSQTVTDNKISIELEFFNTEYSIPLLRN